MRRTKRRGGFASAYAKFRTGKGFFAFIAAFCAFWIGWNKTPWLPHFDDPDGFPLLTLVLSVESSLSVALLMMDQETRDEARERQEASDRQRDKYMLELTETARDNTAAIRDLLLEQKEAHSCGSGSGVSSSSPPSSD